MKKEHIASRLKELMTKRNLRQVDILNLALPYSKTYNVKINKSDLSQYCSGKTEPNQDKLYVLGAALDVNEAWLMGYDVPMERIHYENFKKTVSPESIFFKYLENLGYHVGKDNLNRFLIQRNDDTIEIEAETFHKIRTCIDTYTKNTIDSVILKFYEQDLQPMLRNMSTWPLSQTIHHQAVQGNSYLEPNAAHERTDIDITPEGRRHDDDIMNDDSEWK